MSLERMALRLATVMALSNGSQAPFPTVAGGRVYDARCDSVQVTNEDEVMALIIVNTDDDRGSSISMNNGGPPFERSVTLSIDLHLGIKSETGDDVMSVATEADLERRLDLFEYQVERVLTHRQGLWGAQFDRVARRIMDYSSVRYVERDANVRIAARQIQMTVMLPLADDGEDVFTIAPGAPAVPEPLGPLLDAIIDDGGPFAADAIVIRNEFLAAGAGAQTTILPLLRVRVLEDERDDQNRRTTVRPGGIAEFTLEQ